MNRRTGRPPASARKSRSASHRSRSGAVEPVRTEDELRERLERAGHVAESWISAIAGGTPVRHGRSGRLDGFSATLVLSRARACIESDPAWAEQLARALLEVVPVIAEPVRTRDDLTLDLLGLLLTLRRRAGDHVEAHAYLAAIRLLAGGERTDPLAEAELLEEEAELEAAAARPRDAISVARRALRIYSEPYAAPRLRVALVRRIDEWAKAAAAAPDE